MITSHAYCTEEITSHYSIWFPLFIWSTLFELTTRFSYLPDLVSVHERKVEFLCCSHGAKLFCLLTVTSLSFKSEKEKRNFEEVNCSVFIDFNAWS